MLVVYVAFSDIIVVKLNTGNLCICVFQAILGGTIQVPTLTGDVVLKVSVILKDIIFLMALSVTGEV